MRKLWERNVKYGRIEQNNVVNEIVLREYKEKKEQRIWGGI